MILKARQMGFTTFIDALIFIDTINTPNTQSIIVAQDETNAKRIFQIVKRYYDTLPESKFMKATSDSSDMLYWKEIDSSFFVGWAGSRKLGRGGTINNIHLSEAAFYENAGDLIGGLLQSVPQSGNVFVESTANGVSNYFYSEYQNAINNSSVFKARFFPWTLDPEYQSDTLVVGGEFIPTADEESLMERFGLTEKQLIWRRNKILELLNARIAGNESLGLFPQEYPLTADEAFLTTGVSFFDNDLITNDLMPQCKPHIEMSFPISCPKLRQINNRGFNYIHIWKKPVPGRHYVLTADPSEGLSLNGDRDFCSTDVVDYESFEQVATIHGRWEPEEYAQILAELGSWYNMALIVVERNNHGHSVINSLLNQYMYPAQKRNICSGVYYHIDFDAKRGARGSKPGYPSNVKTKVLYLDALNQVVSDGSLIVNDRRTLEEMKLYTRLPGKKFGCLIGHDDRVTSIALASVILTDTNYARKILSSNTPSQRKKSGKIRINRAVGFM